MSRLRHVLLSLGRIYLLRVPLLTALGILGFCFAALAWPPVATLVLGNAFDISSFWGIFSVSWTAFLAAWVVMVTWRLIRLHGPERFSNAPPPISRELRWRDLLPYAAITLAVLAGVAGKSLAELAGAPGETAEFWWWIVRAVPAALLGLLASLICLTVVAVGQLLFTRPDYARLRTGGGDDGDRGERNFPDLFLPLEVWLLTPLIEYVRRRNPAGGLAGRIARFFDRRLPEDGGRGYVKRNERGEVVSLQPGHGAAIVLFLVTIAVYLLIGYWGYLMLGGISPIPTLCYLLLLAILLCWTFSGMAFFLDLYRIPVLALPVALLLAAAACSIGPDYYYPVLEDRHAEEGAPGHAAAGRKASSDGSIIVVAANGGGIQAAAWTARVLTGLEEKCRDTEGCGNRFGESIRLISSVSGGSAGTMYFVNEYEEGSLPQEDKELHKIVDRAEESSLDQVAWGLLYPDLARTLNPTPYVRGPLLAWDRGRALEKAWLREETVWPRREGVKEGLFKWRNDAKRLRRPAVIFNTTVAETGERLPLATIKLPPKSHGRKSYGRLFKDTNPKPDIRVVTAARLSASFPYVSPAARADVPADEQAHLVDGGYYDNYGVSSLVEWLDWKLEEQMEENRPEDLDIDNVLIVEIRGAPTADHPDSKSDQGWFYQVVAPAAAVFKVRGTGQRIHNDTEIELLKEKWSQMDEQPVTITRAVFEYDTAGTPLSWHLTEDDKLNVEENWKDELDKPRNRCVGWEKVKTFLTPQPEECG